ncbi:MAG: DUF1223 domain-containing protein [Cohaesibacter sp.]|nr:DUF1223 domain-containing protein [Cohaesibacter sp.]
MPLFKMLPSGRFHSLLMRPVVAASALMLALPLSFAMPAHASSPVVVELFTSQGCSSCPPADRLLGEMVGDGNIIALTEAVDYWDYLGWKDENARPEHSARQRDYARMRGDRRVYTPQMVINGRVHVVGSRRGDVASAIKRFEKDVSVPLEVTRKTDVLTIDIGARPANFSEEFEGNVLIAYYKREVEVDIKRGENRGETVRYHNVVGDIRTIGMWKGDALSIELPMSEVRKKGFDGCAVFLQADVRGYPGPIYGAAQLELNE